MLLVAKRRRMAVNVAVLPLAASLAMGGAAAEKMSLHPSDGVIAATLLAGGMLVYALATMRVIRGRAHTLVVSSLFGAKSTFDARAAAFGVAASDNARGRARYTVYVTDGMRNSDVAAYASRRALGAATQLTETFAVPDKGGSNEARGLVAREIAAWKAQEDEARRDEGWPDGSRVPLLIGVAVTVGVAVMGVVMYLGQ
jgi:hypothetical protein